MDDLQRGASTDEIRMNRPTTHDWNSTLRRGTGASALLDRRASPALRRPSAWASARLRPGPLLLNAIVAAAD